MEREPFAKKDLWISSSWLLDSLTGFIGTVNNSKAQMFWERGIALKGHFPKIRRFFFVGNSSCPQSFFYSLFKEVEAAPTRQIVLYGTCEPHLTLSYFNLTTHYCWFLTLKFISLMSVFLVFIAYLSGWVSFLQIHILSSKKYVTPQISVW